MYHSSFLELVHIINACIWGILVAIYCLYISTLPLVHVNFQSKCFNLYAPSKCKSLTILLAMRNIVDYNLGFVIKYLWGLILILYLNEFSVPNSWSRTLLHLVLPSSHPVRIGSYLARTAMTTRAREKVKRRTSYMQTATLSQEPHILFHM